MGTKSAIGDDQLLNSDLEAAPHPLVSVEAMSKAGRFIGNQFSATMHAQLSGPLRDLLLSLLRIQSDNEVNQGVPEIALRTRLKKAIEETEQVRDIVDRLCVGSALAHHPDAVSDGPGLGVWLPPGRSSVAGELQASLRGPRGALTAREQEVLGLINAGSSNKEGAHHLHISIRTFEAHRAQIMRKLGARNAADLVRMTFNRLP